MIFQNCLKFHSPNSSWNYVSQSRNITLGIYAKCHYKSCYQAYTNFNLHVKLLVPDSKWMVTLNIVTTVYSCCLISRPYSCLFDNSLCFNLWITLVKILSNYVLHNNLEISLMVFMPNITTNHAITHTNLIHFKKYRKLEQAGKKTHNTS